MTPTAVLLDRNLATGGNQMLTILVASVATQTMNINKDQGCSRTIDTDMVPGSRLGPDAIMALLGIEDHSYCHGPNVSMALRCQRVPGLQPRP